MGKHNAFMAKQMSIFKIVCFAMVCTFILGGCSGGRGQKKQPEQEEGQKSEQLGPEERQDNEQPDSEEGQRSEQPDSDEGQKKQPDSETGQADTGNEGVVVSEGISEEELAESEEAQIQTVEADWSEYFDGLNGSAAIYDVSNMRCTVFNAELAQTRRSPCSTFKIISSLIALEEGIIVPEDSTHTWSGEVFWNEDWNHDIDFHEAFRASCVWYFREVVDEIGQEKMQEELNRLRYGNCDISDWEGRLNTNNSNRALTGFWIESSLAVSPIEQTAVMERIFGEESAYSGKTLDALKQVMLVPDLGADVDDSNISIYGKTGMGKDQGVVVDAWFTGFAEHEGRNIYFCAYLGRNDGMNVSSAIAKDIAIRLVSDYCNTDE